jgi:hypothetical protein
MDTVNPSNPAEYNYQRMVNRDFIDSVAEQIVAGVVEFLFDQQPEMDSVTYDNDNLSTLW